MLGIALFFAALFMVSAVVLAYVWFGVAQPRAEALRLVKDGQERTNAETRRRDAQASGQIETLRRTLEQLQTDTLHERSEHATALARYGRIVDVEVERERVLSDLKRSHREWASAIEELRGRHAAETASHTATIEAAAREAGARQKVAAARLAEVEDYIRRLRAEAGALEEQAELRSFGFYQPRYKFDSASAYQKEVDEVRGKQKAMLKDKTAARCAIEWTVNGSVAEGKKQIKQTLRLMLRAFNGESDAATAKVRYDNAAMMIGRVEKAAEAINALAEVQRCTISDAFVRLKVDELSLVHEYEAKLQQEREEQRSIREQMREEEIARKEHERAKLDAEREEQRATDALQKAMAKAEEAMRGSRAVDAEKQAKMAHEIEELKKRLAEASTNKERAIAQAQLTKYGYVYVISNIGSFGDNVFKIGMTRRLEPQDRVDELGNASVPFAFDVHAMISSNDAPRLEADLHRAFHHHRVNRVNERKEFFRATLEEIEQVARRMHATEFRVTRVAEAAHYRQTLAMIEAGSHGATPPPNAAVYTETPAPVMVAEG